MKDWSTSWMWIKGIEVTKTCRRNVRRGSRARHRESVHCILVLSSSKQTSLSFKRPLHLLFFRSYTFFRPRRKSHFGETNLSADKLSTEPVEERRDGSQEVARGAEGSGGGWRTGGTARY